MPDASFLVTDVDGEFLRVSAFHPTSNRLVDVGWIETEGLRGKTIHDFNWAEWIARRTSE